MRGDLVNGPRPTLSVQELLPSLDPARAGAGQDLFWIGPVYHFRRSEHPQYGLHIRTGCRRFTQPGCRHTVERVSGCRQPAGQKRLAELIATDTEGLAHCLGERSRRALEYERPQRSPARPGRTRATGCGSARHWVSGHSFAWFTSDIMACLTISRQPQIHIHDANVGPASPPVAPRSSVRVQASSPATPGRPAGPRDRGGSPRRCPRTGSAPAPARRPGRRGAARCGRSAPR